METLLARESAARPGAEAHLLGRIAASPLGQAGGFRVVDLLTEEFLAALAAEALAHQKTAAESLVEEPLDEGFLRGRPDRWLESAAGGPALASLIRAPALAALLESLTGVRWIPSGEQGTFSYYCRPGHFLGLHRDVEECDLAVIACVHELGCPAQGVSGSLCLYPGREGESLAAIRANQSEGALHFRLRPGQAMVLLGGMIPHRLVPLEAGHVRIVAPLCFSAAA